MLECSVLCVALACPNAPVPYWYCKASGRCLDPSLLCNSRRDCPDDSDEVNCSQYSAGFTNLLYTLCLKKVPTFKLSVTSSNLNRFSKFLHCWQAYEICYKIHTTLSTSPQVRCYTLPWEIKNSNFLPIFSRCGRRCKQLAYLSPLTLLFIQKF